MSRTPALLTVAGLLAAGSALAQPSPYSGLESRPIKALSPAQIEQYRSGQGMGFALPAELNGYPGPRHVLELAAELGLTDEQSARVRAVFEAMHGEAVRLGERVVAGEARLERLFAGGTITPAALEQALDDLARLQAQLRYAHLAAHLETRALLSEEQAARYDELRGYGEGDGSGHPGHHGAHGERERPG